MNAQLPPGIDLTPKKFTADEILDALIAHSDDKIWAVELPFRGSSTRIDFFTLDVSKSKNFRTVSYEIKVSRSDFKRDSQVKQRGALEFSDRFYYVTPPGMLDKSDVPDWAGLLEWCGAYPSSGLKVIKRAPKREKSEPCWGVIVDVIRNSGQCRRDVSLMVNHLKYYEAEVKRMGVLHDIRHSRQMLKFSKRSLTT